MIRTFLVDDSPRSLKTLTYLLDEFCPQIEVVGEAKSVDEALEKILILKPQLLFLDIEMPRKSGFELLVQLKDYPHDLQVIFVTAFDQFALKAIKFCALDYILKPVDHKDLIQAVHRAEETLKPIAENQKYLQFLQNLQQPSTQQHKIALPTQMGYRFLPLSEIIRFEADGNYVRIFLADKTSFLATRRLKEMQDLLEHEKFIRIHRSHIVNMNYIQQFHRSDGGVVFMDDGAEISVARAHRMALMKALQIEP